MAKNNFHDKNLKMVQLAVLAATMVVLQIAVTLLVRVGAVAPTLALIPLVIGSAALGVKAGVVLGTLFGAIAYICGLTNLDTFTNLMITYKPFETAMICILKAVLAGVISALVFKFVMRISKKKLFPAALASSVIAPIVNTAVYVLGMALFFRELVPGYTFTDSDAIWVVIGSVFMIIITNFIMEVIVTGICSPIVMTALSKNKEFKKMLFK